MTPNKPDDHDRLLCKLASSAARYQQTQIFKHLVTANIKNLNTRQAPHLGGNVLHACCNQRSENADLICFLLAKTNVDFCHVDDEGNSVFHKLYRNVTILDLLYKHWEEHKVRWRAIASLTVIRALSQRRSNSRHMHGEMI